MKGGAMIRCGHCKQHRARNWRQLREHVTTCAAKDPWGAYRRAKTQQEARQVLIDHLGVKPPPPMSEEAKQRLRELARDPAAKAKREQRKRAQRERAQRELVRAVSSAAKRGRRRA